MINKCFLLVLLLLCGRPQAMQGQTALRGLVSDLGTGKVVAGAAVMLYDGKNRIDTFFFTDPEGMYCLLFADTGKYELGFSAAGYITKRLLIDVGPADPSKNGMIADVALERQPYVLEEVLIRPVLPVLNKGDTLVFDAASFMRGNEQVLQELLRQIPGINVSEDGSIRVGYQEIEKIMVDGADFFGKGYRILSGSMPVHPVDKVELIKHYVANRTVKGIGHSDRIALNIRLKSEGRSPWFGMLGGGVDPVSARRYELRAEAMNFDIRSKYYIVNHFQHAGQKPIEAIQSVYTVSEEEMDLRRGIRPVRFLDPFPLPSSGISKERIYRDGTGLSSWNAIFKLSDRVKLHLLSVYEGLRGDFSSQQIERILLPDTTIDRREASNAEYRKRTVLGSLGLTWDIAPNQIFESKLRFTGGLDRDWYSYSLNGMLRAGNVWSRQQGIDHQVKYSHRFDERRALLLQSGLALESAPQTAGFEVLQDYRSQHSFRFMGFGGQYLERLPNGDRLEGEIGHLWRRDVVSVESSALSSDFHLPQHSFYQAEWMKGSEFYFKTRYRHSMSQQLSFSGHLKVYSFSDSLGNLSGGGGAAQRGLGMDPGFSMDWQPGNKQKLVVGYTFSTAGDPIQDIHTQYVLTGLRSAVKGTGIPGRSRVSAWFANHQFGDWTGGLLCNSMFYFMQYPRQISGHIRIFPDYTLTEKEQVAGSFFASLQSNLDYYMEVLRVNLKLDIASSVSTNKTRINGVDMSSVLYRNLRAGIALRSGFKGWFNFHAGTKWSLSARGKTEADQHLQNFMDILFVYPGRCDFSIQYEWYFFNENIGNGIASGFLDTSLRYAAVENRLTFFMNGKNLLGRGELRYSSLRELGYMEEIYRLNPRMILLGISIRF